MISERRQRTIYILTDYISTNIAFLLFNIIRYLLLPSAHLGFGSLMSFLASPAVLAGQILFPVCMMGIYYLSGYYSTVFVKSRVQEMSTTLCTAFIGSLFTFLVILVNDLTHDRAQDYSIIVILLALLFFVVYIPRLIITWHTTDKIVRGEIFFNTLIVGYSSIPQLFPRQLQSMSPVTGIKIVGLIDSENKSRYCISGTDLPITDISEVRDYCRDNDIKRIIIIPHPQGWERTLAAINPLFSLDLPLFVAADRLPAFMFKTKMLSITAEPFIDITRTHLSPSTINIKRACDVVISAIMLTIAAVPLLICALAIRLDSKGPVLYRQRRIGLHRKPFTIYKLRTMYHNAESSGRPELSHPYDSRVTKVGTFLRKYRLDEMPQFFNVLRGDMSLVGPRPERMHFIEQILEREPSYALIHRVRPGITSLGMVKYGYATNVDQMVERMRYDLLYLHNISIITDIKILLYTAHTVLSGKGI